jgi:hypothetical protein
VVHLGSRCPRTALRQGGAEHEPTATVVEKSLALTNGS